MVNCHSEDLEDCLATKSGISSEKLRPSFTELHDSALPCPKCQDSIACQISDQQSLPLPKDMHYFPLAEARWCEAPAPEGEDWSGSSISAPRVAGNNHRFWRRTAPPDAGSVAVWSQLVSARTTIGQVNKYPWITSLPQSYLQYIPQLTLEASKQEMLMNEWTWCPCLNIYLFSRGFCPK